MIDKPLVSIIIPVYNVENYLEFCIRSVLEQTYCNIEVILIDDGSTDSSGELCDKLSKDDKRIHVIHKNNGGLSSARNVGLEVMSGDYFAFIDSDDFVRSDYIEKMLLCSQKCDVDLVICSYKKVLSDTNFHDIKCKSMQPTILNQNDALFNMIMRKIPMYSHGKLFKSYLKKYLSFPEGFLFEDIPTTWSVINQVDKIAYSNEQLYFYRQRNNSIVNESYKHSRMDQLYFWEKIQSTVSAHDLLYIAIETRCFYSAVDNYALVSAEFADDKRYLINAIKKYRHSVLSFHGVGIALKIMALVSYIYIPLVRILGKGYKKYNNLKFRCTKRGI